MAGQLIAKNATELWSGTLRHPINITELGQVRDTQAWTGTRWDGQVSLGLCHNWTATPLCLQQFTAECGISGQSTVTNANWTYRFWDPCNLLQSLYCIEQ